MKKAKKVSEVIHEKETGPCYRQSCLSKFQQTEYFSLSLKKKIRSSSFVRLLARLLSHSESPSVIKSRNESLNSPLPTCRSSCSLRLINSIVVWIDDLLDARASDHRSLLLLLFLPHATAAATRLLKRFLLEKFQQPFDPFPLLSSSSSSSSSSLPLWLIS